MRNTSLYKLIQYRCIEVFPPLEEVKADMYMNVLKKYPENEWFDNEMGNPDNDYEVLEKLSKSGIIMRISIPLIVNCQFKGLITRYLYSLDLNYKRYVESNQAE